jgi:hypothetical protein
LVKRFANNRASLLLRHYSDSSLLQTPPPPSYHKPISQRLLVIGFTFSSNFLLGQVGLLQSLSMSLLSYCRYYPAGIVQTQQPVFVWLYCLRLQIAGSASRVLFRLRGHLCVYFRYGLITCSSPFMMTLLIGFRDLVTLLPAIQATGLLAFTLTGLSPAEHTSLSWTHNLVRNLLLGATKQYLY